MAKFKKFYKFYLSGWLLLFIACCGLIFAVVPGLLMQLMAVLITIYIHKKPVIIVEEQGWLDLDTKIKKIKDPFQWLNHIALNLAISVDKLCNVLFSYLLDVTFTKVYYPPKDTFDARPWSLDPYKFGNHRDTISEVIGRNKQLGTLTRFGIMIDWILDRIDHNHSENAVE